MRRWTFLITALAALALPLPVFADAPPVFRTVENFGPNLSTICPQPEGIAIDPQGNLYAASFAFAKTANICVISQQQKLVKTIPVSAGPAGVASLLGELFVPGEGLYVVDFGTGSRSAPNGRLLRVDPSSGKVTPIVTGFFSAPNAIARDRHGNLFVSDSFQGRIYRVAPGASRPTVWIDSPLLRTDGQPPFGANGLAFDEEQELLYVANTGDSRVLRIEVEDDGSAGEIEIFADGRAIDADEGTMGALHGADGIMFDVKGNLYVCANQENEIQVLSPGGDLIARYRGTGDGALDFPASLVFRGTDLFITNLSLGTVVNSKLSILRVPDPGLPL